MHLHPIELLEARIAPAAVFVNPSVATYTDEDGDFVLVRFSKPILSAANIATILVTSAAGSGERLDLIDLQNRPAASGTDIVVSTRVAGLGDGLANVGIINATNVDLGVVTVHGDLGQILAGNTATQTPGLKNLNLHTFGVIASLGGIAPEISGIAGSVGTVVVTGDMIGANLSVNASAAAEATIGTVFVGGSVVGGPETLGGVIFAKGNIGTVVIRRSLIGEKISSGLILSDSGTIGTVRIGGSILGGAEEDSGFIFGASIGSVTVARNVFGGAGDRSGEIFAGNRIGTVTIGGSLFGGAGENSGRITTNGVIGSVTVGGSVIGGANAQTGFIDAGTALGPIRIGGSLVGGSSDFSGGIVCGGNIGAIAIGGDLVGGGTDDTIGETGEIRSVNGSIASIRIGGSAISGFGSFNGCILAARNIGPVTVVGDIDSFGDAFFLIRAGGAPSGNAIAAITVGGTVTNTAILAGYGTSNAGVNGNASIGPVIVGGSWIASSIAAGVENPNVPFFGDANDSIIAGATLVSRIASINIAGYIRGTDGGTDQYGFVAQQIGSFTLAGSVIPLTATAHTDNRPIGLTGDFTIHEVQGGRELSSPRAETLRD